MTTYKPKLKGPSREKVLIPLNMNLKALGFLVHSQLCKFNSTRNNTILSQVHHEKMVLIPSNMNLKALGHHLKLTIKENQLNNALHNFLSSNPSWVNYDFYGS